MEWRFAGEEANSIFLSAALDDSIRVWYIDKPVPIAVLRLVEVSILRKAESIEVTKILHYTSFIYYELGNKLTEFIEGREQR